MRHWIEDAIAALLLFASLWGVLLLAGALQPCDPAYEACPAKQERSQ